MRFLPAMVLFFAVFVAPPPANSVDSPGPVYLEWKQRVSHTARRLLRREWVNPFAVADLQRGATTEIESTASDRAPFFRFTIRNASGETRAVSPDPRTLREGGELEGRQDLWRWLRGAATTPISATSTVSSPTRESGP